MNTTPARLWALAVPGILTQRNGHDHGLLGGAASSPEVAQDRATVLRRDWDAADRAGLVKSLDWLARDGHRREFNQVCALDQEVCAKLQPWETVESAIDDKELLAKIHFTRRHRERVGTRSLLVWDMVRLVSVAGWGFLAGMISEDEAWSYIIPAAQTLQRAYASWDELGKHHLLGREFWAGEWDGRFARCHLAMFDDLASPWRTLPWSTDLTQHGLAVPMQTIVIEPLPPPRPVVKKAVIPPSPVEDLEPGAGSMVGMPGRKTVGIWVAVVILLALVGAGLAFAPRFLSRTRRSGVVPPAAAPAPKPSPASTKKH